MKIGAHEYTVKFIPQSEMMKAHGDYWGIHMPGSNEISIVAELNDNRKIVTFLHEIMHAIDKMHDLEINHNTINSLSEGLGQILIDADLFNSKKLFSKKLI